VSDPALHTEELDRFAFCLAGRVQVTFQPRPLSWCFTVSQSVLSRLEAPPKGHAVPAFVSAIPFLQYAKVVSELKNRKGRN
jgi:hypothetical protein